jgi:hypothetical protein
MHAEVIAHCEASRRRLTVQVHSYERPTTRGLAVKQLSAACQKYVQVELVNW